MMKEKSRGLAFSYLVIFIILLFFKKLVKICFNDDGLE